MRLSILYSAPLIDEQGHPISLLDFASEKQSLKESFDESGRAFEVFFGAATVDHLQEQVSQGCEILHYSGHGHPDFLAFEGKTGVAHALEVRTLKNRRQTSDKTRIYQRMSFAGNRTGVCRRGCEACCGNPAYYAGV